MTRNRIAQHVEQFKEMGILANSFKATSKEALVNSLSALINMYDRRLNQCDASEAEQTARLLEDARWARAQVL